MKNVTINGKKYERDGEMPVKLNNGSLVVHCNKMGDVLGAYMVTSFRDSKGDYRGQTTLTYCSLLVILLLRKEQAEVPQFREC